MLLVHLFECFVHVKFCHLSLPLGVGGWLRFVIVALRQTDKLYLLSNRSNW